MVPSYATLPANLHSPWHYLPLLHCHIASCEKQWKEANREASRKTKYLPSISPGGDMLSVFKEGHLAFQKRSREGQPN